VHAKKCQKNDKIDVDAENQDLVYDASSYKVLSNFIKNCIINQKLKNAYLAKIMDLEISNQTRFHRPNEFNKN
jgi:hypothetical protein